MNNRTALAQRGESSVQAFSGTYHDGNALTALLVQAASEYHLVSPAPSCSMLPEGFGVALSSVLVNPSDCYSTGAGGKLGLPKAELDRIAGAAGISWDPHLSRRLDDGRDPHYCAFKAVGYVKQFDASTLTIVATKEMDLREGSAQCEALHAKIREPGKTADNQIREMRLHILSHAETKARLRAIRAIGIRTGYTREELAKPFVVARLMFTGQSNDPELRRLFAMKRADAALNDRSALYGAPTPPAMALAAPMAAPAVGASAFDDDDRDEYVPTGEPVGAPVAQTPATPPSEPRPVPPPSAPVVNGQQRSAPAAAPSSSGFVIPAGRSKGTSLEQASDNDLAYWADRIEGELRDGTSRFPDRDRPLMEAMRTEQVRRERY